MVNATINKIFVVGSALLAATSAFGQSEWQLRPRQMPGWDPRAREGRCEIRVWVDNRAEVRMRGDTIYVKTLEGSRSRDENSQCSQPVPYNFVADFNVRQLAGRSRIVLAEPPNRNNNFTSLINIEDRQGGGDLYAFEVTWRAEQGDMTNNPAPFFDEIRACQDFVRQRFLSRNGRGSYIDFDNFPTRQGTPGRGRGRGRGTELIQGRGSARSWNETRPVSYSCSVDNRNDVVTAGSYEYIGDSVRMNERRRLQ